MTFLSLVISGILLEILILQLFAANKINRIARLDKHQWLLMTLDVKNAFNTVP